MTTRLRAGAVVAGVDVDGGVARVALVASQDSQHRVRAVEREPLPSRALVRGVVRDPEQVERAVRAALARAEERADACAELIAVATAADDLRVHRQVWRAVRRRDTAVSDGEARRARERARAAAARDAVAAFSDEPALRRIALVPLHAVAARPKVDGRPLVAPGRQRGEVLEVDATAPVLPLAHSSGLEAAIAPLARATRYVAAPLALGRLAVASGVEDATVIALGRELTNICVVREAVPLGARAFSVGAASFEARPDDAAEGDTAVWARCVALGAIEAAGREPLSRRVLLSADARRFPSLVAALRDALRKHLPVGDAVISDLTAAIASVVTTDTELDPGDLVAVAAGID